MPKTPTRTLKVFQAQFGFFDTVLAVPSQAAALRVWGTHRNLFATGHAKLATDEAAIAAALEHPGTLLRRAVGSNDPFSIEPTSLPTVPDLAAAMPKSKRTRGNAETGTYGQTEAATQAKTGPGAAPHRDCGPAAATAAPGAVGVSGPAAAVILLLV